MHHRQFVAAVAAACAVAVAVARAQQPASITVTGPVALTSAARDASHGYPFNASTLDLAEAGVRRGRVLHPGHGAQLRHPAGSDVERHAGGRDASLQDTDRRSAAGVGRRSSTARSIVEWTNVSEGFDNEVDWFHSAEHFVQRGLRVGRRVGAERRRQRAEAVESGPLRIARRHRRRNGHGRRAVVRHLRRGGAGGARQGPARA